VEDGIVKKPNPRRLFGLWEVQFRRNPFGGFKDCDEAQMNGMMVAAAF
jgi:hypothetical protein